MTNGRTVDFGVLFGSMWRLFASNYGILLGFSFLVIGVMIGMGVVVYGIGIALVESGLAPLGGAMIATCVDLVLSILIFYPVTAYIGYAILKRGRASAEPAKPGRYAAVVSMSILQAAFIFPGAFIHAASNPSSFSNPGAMFSGAGESSGGKSASSGSSSSEISIPDISVGSGSANVSLDLNESTSGSKSDSKPAAGSSSLGLALVGTLVMIAGSLVALLWFPWAYLAVLDPRNEVSSAAAALRYGRELNAPMRASMYAASIVVTLILIGTIILCVLPALFFGLPLVLAAFPAFYMAMRGENEPEELQQEPA